MTQKRKDTRRRYMFRFFLNINKPDQLKLAERLESLRLARQFAPTLRNALKLFFDLLAGNTTELRRQFPGIVADLEAPKQPAGIADLLATQTAILERLTVQGINTSAMSQRAAIGFYPGELPALPSMDTTPADNGSEARANFAGSMGDLFGADDGNLWE